MGATAQREDKAPARKSRASRKMVPGGPNQSHPGLVRANTIATHSRDCKTRQPRRESEKVTHPRFLSPSFPCPHGQKPPARWASRESLPAHNSPSAVPSTNFQDLDPMVPFIAWIFRHIRKTPISRKAYGPRPPAHGKMERTDFRPAKPR